MTWLKELEHIEGWGTHIFKDGELIAVVFDDKYVDCIESAIDDKEPDE